MGDPACHPRYVAAEQIVLMTAPQWWEITAALATAISAGVIAWQAFLTRKSVAASEKAVAVAQAALVESQLARIEAGAPRLLVRAQGWVAADDARLRSDPGTSPRPVTTEDVFKLPRDGKVSLGISYPIEIRNDGPSTAVVMIASRYTNGNSIGFNVQLAPGESKEQSVWFARSVAEWVELTDDVGEDGKRTGGKSAGAITVTYRGPRDADLDEVHTMQVIGSLLLPVADAQGDWRPHLDPFEPQSFGIGAPTVERIYWRSRQAGQKFELVELI